MPAPVANDDNLSTSGPPLYSLNEDTVLSVAKGTGVLANDTDADPSDANKLAAAISSGGLPDNPLFTFRTTGAFTYDARYHGDLYINSSGLLVSSTSGTLLDNGFNSLAAGAVAIDTFQYVATDGQDTSTATAYVYITGVNDAPVAADDDAGNVFQSALPTTVNVLFNDTDVDVWPTPDTLTITSLNDINDTTGAIGSGALSITTDAGGVVTVVNGEVQYTNSTGFVGIDTVRYTVSDGNSGTDTGVIRFTVLPANAAPDAKNDTYTIGEDAVATSFTSVLLANGNGADTDPDSEILGAKLVAGSLIVFNDGSSTVVNTNPGILVDFNADGTFDYNPNGVFNYLKAGETAIVQFQYTAFDNLGLADTATVTLQIVGANDAPPVPPEENRTVYEAGLSTGSGDGTTTKVQTINFALGPDPDGDTLRLVTAAGAGTNAVLTGTYGTLKIIDADTVEYTLTSSATHAATAGHNATAPGGLSDILDEFDLYITDDVGTFVASTSNKTGVNITVVDDIVLLGLDGPNAAVGDDLNNGTVNFAANAFASDTFDFIEGADGASLQFTGRPGNFTLLDGRVVTSSVSSDGLTITGKTGTTDFYKLELIDTNGAAAGGWTQKFTLLQGPPSVINPIDFSSVKAGGPHETLTVESIKFDGGFFTPLNTGLTGPTNIFPITQSATSNDDINPNNGGGIGIGNGNIERGEVLGIDVTGNDTPAPGVFETGVSFVLQGIGGGVSGVVDVLWVAVKNGVVVASGTKTTTNINASNSVDFDNNGTFETNGEVVTVIPGVAFDQIYVALDPDGARGIDANDAVRINKIATIETQNSGDFVLPFSIRGIEGAIDGDVTQEEQFTWTINGPAATSTTVTEFDLL